MTTELRNLLDPIARDVVCRCGMNGHDFPDALRDAVDARTDEAKGSEERQMLEALRRLLVKGRLELPAFHDAIVARLHESADEPEPAA